MGKMQKIQGPFRAKEPGGAREGSRDSGSCPCGRAPATRHRWGSPEVLARAYTRSARSLSAAPRRLYSFRHVLEEHQASYRCALLTIMATSGMILQLKFGQAYQEKRGDVYLAPPRVQHSNRARAVMNHDPGSDRLACHFVFADNGGFPPFRSRSS